MTENNETIQVSIPVQETEPAPEAESSPVVIINEDDNGGSGEAVEAATIDQEGRIVRLELGQDAILAKLEEIAAALIINAEATAAVAEDVEEVEEQVLEALTEVQAEPDTDEEPDREHPFYRDRRLFGRSE